MASIFKGRVFIAGGTDVVEAHDVGGGVHITWRGGKSPMALHLVRGAVVFPRVRILEGAAALRYTYERVHAPLFPIGEFLSRAAMQGAAGG